MHKYQFKVYINYSFRDTTMVYEHDVESPFREILVKDDSAVVGVIRRNLKTGEYQFYNDITTLHYVMKASRIERIKSKIETLIAVHSN